MPRISHRAQPWTPAIPSAREKARRKKKGGREGKVASRSASDKFTERTSRAGTRQKRDHPRERAEGVLTLGGIVEQMRDHVERDGDATARKRAQEVLEV